MAEAFLFSLKKFKLSMNHLALEIPQKYFAFYTYYEGESRGCLSETYILTFAARWKWDIQSAKKGSFI